MLKRLFLEAALDDDVDAFALFAVVDREVGGTDEEKAALAGSVIRDLLITGKLVPGVPTRAGFVPWRITGAEAADVIDAEWQRIVPVPEFGDIAWFDITTKGRSDLGDA